MLSRGQCDRSQALDIWADARKAEAAENSDGWKNLYAPLRKSRDEKEGGGEKQIP